MSVFYTSLNKPWLDEVNSRGLTNPNSVTKTWVEMNKHPVRDEWCVNIPDAFIFRLSEIVSSVELVKNAQGPFTLEQMLNDGWFQ